VSGQWRMFLRTARSSVEENVISDQYPLALFSVTLMTTLFILFTSYFSGSGTKSNLSMTIYVVMVLIMVYAAIRTVSSFSGEIDGRTMEILFSLPIERSTLFFGKLTGLMVAMVPVVAMPFIAYLIMLSIVTGAVPVILLSMAAELFLLSVLTTFAIIALAAFISLLLRRTLYSLGVTGAYLLMMLFISPVLNDFSGQRIVYAPDYVAMFPFPYAILAAGTKSVRVMNGADPVLYAALILFTLIVLVLGLLIVRRMEL
jgi:ABC-type transport system involved in multi-copper enzyme maturation permease subunit